MQYSNLDTESILSCSQQWLELNHKWGEPVDLEDQSSRSAVQGAGSRDPDGALVIATSSADHDRATFDSAKFIYKLKQTKKAARCCHDSQNYYNSTERISNNNVSDTPSGNNTLVQNICREIDAILPRISSGVNELKRAVNLAMQQDSHETTDVTQVGEAKNLVMQASIRSEVDQSNAGHASESSLSSFDLSVEDGEGYSADVESFDDSKWC